MRVHDVTGTELFKCGSRTPDAILDGSPNGPGLFGAERAARFQFDPHNLSNCMPRRRVTHPDWVLAIAYSFTAKRKRLATACLDGCDPTPRLRATGV